MTRLVRVTPICAPESWVDRVRSASRTPSACRSPSPAAFSTAARSTATKAYSAAPKTPHASTRPTEIPSSSHSMLPIVAGRAPARAPRRSAPRAGGNRGRVGRRWTGKRGEQVLRFSGVAAEPRGPGAHRQRGLGVPRARPACSSPTASGALLRARSPRPRRRTSSRPLRSPTRRATRSHMLRGGVRLAQEQIAPASRRDPARAGMATTLTAVATDGERFALAHVGDSRGYVFRDGT